LAAWEHPNLYPACMFVVLAAQLYTTTEQMLSRVEKLLRRLASLDQARNGESYDLLRCVEYSAGVTRPNADGRLDAPATRIVEMLDNGKFEDAEHFFTLAPDASPEITIRIPNGVIAGQIDRLLDEQQDDGGWPTPYDESWRVWTTA